MRFLRESLLARLLSYFLLLAILPLAIVGILAYNRSEEILKEHLRNHLTTTAILKEDEINRWVESMKQDTRLLVQNPVLREYAGPLLTHQATSGEFSAAYQSLKSYLDSALAEKTDWLEILILQGVSGEIVLSTNSEHEGNDEVTSTFFIKGRKGTYVQNVYPSVSLGKPAMTIATPLESKGGQMLGVLAVHLDLAELNDIMLERGGLGATGETYLVDQLNAFVSEARFGGESFPRGVHTQGIDAALLRKADGAGIYDNYRGVPVIGAYRWLDDREMALLAEIELDEALAPVRGLALAISVVAAIATILVAATAYVVARQISGPILTLATTSTQIASGDLHRTVAIQRDDEIGTLARAFNSMAEWLRGLIEILEQRVAERTAELERRTMYLGATAEVNRVIMSILDAEQLVRQVAELIRERFELYYVGLFLLDETGEWAVLRAGTGEAGRAMLARGHRIRVGEGMVGWSIAHAEARIALEAGADAVHLATAELPDTRSEAALPLRSRGQVLGAITVQHTEPGAFDREAIVMLQTMADQVAVALDNARLFAESQSALEAERRAYGEISRRAWEQVARTRPDLGYRRDRRGLAPAGDMWRPQMMAALQAGTVAHEPGGDLATLAIPIKVRGQTIGVIDARKPEGAGEWTAEEITLAETLTDQLGAALDSARLFVETQRRAHDEQQLRSITAQVRDAPDLNAILQTAVEEVARVLGVERAFVQLGTPPPLEPRREG